jgi:hypothetical protein
MIVGGYAENEEGGGLCWMDKLNIILYTIFLLKKYLKPSNKGDKGMGITYYITVS